ncbi:exonuclease tos isoform X2 [Lasioglossum baleicum]|uniref:exonuclease tos isoform X2 n=1 Tax=Lasioglossum baleicum TaxID=434251 RepID=UPI003FCC891C
MGITGLLPFLEKSSKRTNIDQFTGGTVAIDTYCWLHKGVFCCGDKLAMGKPTTEYVNYCMRYIYMLLDINIKPILVFDGRHLPAKAQTEVKRREARQTNRNKAIELIKMGQHAEGTKLLRRSIDVTHEMALELIKICQTLNVDCIVAPYEADAQLAYLNVTGIADVVITEDSDLTLFGCKKVFFKMDINGNGLLVDQKSLHLAMGLQAEHFSMDSFRYMCILSGCDYLPSLPGIGLHKAKKFITVNTDCDIHRALTRLASCLNMKSLVVTKEYRDAFILAVITFKHQLVFCPLQRKQVRLSPPSSDVSEKQLYYAGVKTNSDIAFQLALGNCHPLSLQMLHDFDPDTMKTKIHKSNAWSRKPTKIKHTSIWSEQYQLENNVIKKSSPKKDIVSQQKTSGNKMILKTNHLKRAILVKQQDNTEYKELNQNEILNMYEPKDTEMENNLDANLSSFSEDKTSPILTRRANPFSTQMSTNKTSPSLLSKGRSHIKGRSRMRVRRTVINENIVTESKFFANTSVQNNSNIITDDDALCSSGNSNESLQKEKDMTTEETNVTNNINNQTLMVIDEMDTESNSMDVDEECNVSFTSNQYNVTHSSNRFSNCDLGKSYLDIQRNEFVLSKNRNHSDGATDSFASSEAIEDSDFFIPREDINTLSSNLFKFSNTNNKAKQCDSRSSSNFGNSNSKTNTTRRSQRLSSAQKQRSLLSMYGFEKEKPLGDSVQRQQSLLSMYGFEKKRLL